MKLHIHSGDLMFYVRQNTTDISIVRNVVDGREYFSRKGDPFEFAVEKGDVVVDIGAHIGSFSVLAGSFGAKVYAYEPFSKSVKILRKNVDVNKFDITYFKKAVADKVKRTTLFVRDVNFGGNNIYYPNQNPAFQEVVDVVSLKEVFEENKLEKIDFLKLDCEGSEFEILDTHKEYLPKISKIAYEYEGNERRMQMFELLKKDYEFIERNNNTFGTVLAKRKS